MVEKLPGQFIGGEDCEILHTEEVFYDFNYGMLMGHNFPVAELDKIND